jgi:Trypsin-co-occurring domain 2
MSDGDGILLADAIDELRRELTDAVARGHGQAIQFELGRVTMEFEVGITTSVEGEARARFWVVSAGGSAGRESSRTHRVTVELTPLTDGQGRVRISERVERERG